jgi:prepilin-type N-terminal cleavage/methylation domain-containing protein
LRGAHFAPHNLAMGRASHPARGFTMVELMIAVALIGIISSIAIPGYQRLTARGRRSELQAIMSKFRLYFKNLHDSQGTFSTPQTLAASAVSDINPSSTVPPGTSAPWVSNASGWTDLPFPPEGAINMRYWYTMGAASADGLVHDVTFQACGSFPGFGPNTTSCATGMNGNYLYTEVLHGAGTYDVVESPEF